MIRNIQKMTLSRALAAILLCISATVTAKPADFDRKTREFTREMAQKHGFDQAELGRLMSGISYRQKIIDAISRPAEAKPWHQYRKIFVTESRAREGVAFWEANKDLLQRAEREFGVSQEIIVAIIGVETRYGRHAGTYPVMDALATLAFGYPKRADFFRRELEEFLLLAREEGLDLTGTKGSYAGAMGMPQFISSSYRAYAVDFDGDGKRDLISNRADVIGSVAAYFKRHGWTRGAPITSPARGAGTGHERFVKGGMKPSFTIDELARSGITPKTPLPGGSLSSLIKLEGIQGNEYWLGLNNFYVITRYNHSNLYAMAVYQLSRKILAGKSARKG